MEFESKFFQNLKNLVADKQYAIAVSGGVDSMTLLHLVGLFHQNYGTLQPTVLTVHHGFRETAEREVELVDKVAKSLGFECYILRAQRISEGTNKSQKLARSIRYSLLSEWCTKNSIKHVLTAHSKNDQAETILLRLERGSGLDGLCGMNTLSPMHNIVIVRPLLDFSRHEILEYANANGISWYEDPSNACEKYRRTFYRRVIAESPSPKILVDRLCRTASHLRRTSLCIQHYTRDAVESCLNFDTAGCVAIDRAKFASVPEEIAHRLFVYALMAVGGRRVKPRYAKFSDAFSLLRSGRPFPQFTMHGCLVLGRSDGRILIAREVADITKRAYVEHLDAAFNWDGRFMVRVLLPPSYVQPNTADTAKISSDAAHKLTTQTDKLSIVPLGHHHVPEHLRDMDKVAVCSLPVLALGNKVLAYPLQNHNISNAPTIGIEGVLVREIVVNQLCHSGSLHNEF